MQTETHCLFIPNHHFHPHSPIPSHHFEIILNLNSVALNILFNKVQRQESQKILNSNKQWFSMQMAIILKFHGILPMICIQPSIQFKIQSHCGEKSPVTTMMTYQSIHQNRCFRPMTFMFEMSMLFFMSSLLVQTLRIHLTMFHMSNIN